MWDKITNVILAGRGPEALLARDDRERRFRGQAQSRIVASIVSRRPGHTVSDLTPSPIRGKMTLNDRRARGQSRIAASMTRRRGRLTFSDLRSFRSRGFLPTMMRDVKAAARGARTRGGNLHAIFHDSIQPAHWFIESPDGAERSGKTKDPVYLVGSTRSAKLISLIDVFSSQGDNRGNTGKWMSPFVIRTNRARLRTDCSPRRRL
jgi:hypothetical protein